MAEEYRPFFYSALGKSLMKNLYWGNYSQEKSISLVNRVEERYRPCVYEGFGRGIAMSEIWIYKGFVAHCIGLIYWTREEDKVAFYR